MEITVLEKDPGVPCCMECSRDVDEYDGDAVELLRQNGGFEWWVYCHKCEVETFSQTFHIEGS